MCLCISQRRRTDESSYSSPRVGLAARLRAGLAARVGLAARELPGLSGLRRPVGSSAQRTERAGLLVRLSFVGEAKLSILEWRIGRERAISGRPHSPSSLSPARRKLVALAVSCRLPRLDAVSCGMDDDDDDSWTRIGGGGAGRLLFSVGVLCLRVPLCLIPTGITRVFFCFRPRPSLLSEAHSASSPSGVFEAFGDDRLPPDARELTGEIISSA